MVEFIGNSRIDGYPMVKIPRTDYIFLEYFRALRDKSGKPLVISLVKELVDNLYPPPKPVIDTNYVVVKVSLQHDDFSREFGLYKVKHLRNERIKKLTHIENENK